MYEACFGLSKRPFASVPRVDEYFPAATIEAARTTLIRCIERAEGTALVVGPSGTGKTLLCQMLAEHFKESFAVAVLSSGRLNSRRALWQAILFELGQPYRGMDEGELRLALVDHLTAGEACPQGMLLLVDEAHTLPLRVLEEIRTLTNLVHHGQPRIRLVLLGGPLLEERFASPKLESFSQRVVARCYLEPFNQGETQQYIHAQVDQAGGNGDELFSPEACQAVYQATDGIPRLVNQVCDHALLLAYTAGRPQVDQACAEEAWADLQQLPTPWNDECRAGKAEGGVIEFGGLENDQTEGDEAAGVPTVSMLRVAPESGEAIAEPAERIEGIQQTLVELEEDFQPAGSIGPEVELVFDDSVSAFDEEFEEEEVVADRHVPRRDGDQQKPAQALDTDDRQTAAQPESPPGRSSQEPVVSERPEPEDVGRDGTADDEAVEPVADGSDDERTAGWGGEPETVPLRHEAAATASESTQAGAAAAKSGVDGEGIIIVEEGYNEGEAQQRHPVVPVRRQAYGRLFATLRRS